MSLLDAVAARNLIVVTGKGGVGKSLLAASLGRILAARGRRVHLLESDPRESLYRFLGVPPSGGESVVAAPGLSVHNLDPRHVVDGLVREFLPVEFLVRRVLASPVYRSFSEGAPGLRETVALAHAVRCLDRRHWPLKRQTPPPETVIFDAPASGHAVSFLEAPSLLGGAVTKGPIGAMVREVTVALADPKRFGIAVATLAEAMPVDETLELVARLRERGHPAPLFVAVNGLYPATDDPADTLWRRRRDAQERELERLRRAWHGPLVMLPLLAADAGPALSGRISEALVTALGALAEAKP